VPAFKDIAREQNYTLARKNFQGGVGVIAGIAQATRPLLTKTNRPERFT
jgi:hypothetical protein